MKKTLLAIAALIAISTTAQANEFQTVRNVEGKSAKEIMTAWKTYGTTADFKSMSPSDNILKFRARTTCEAHYFAKQKLDSDVMIEVKDNKYRVTFEKTNFVDNPDWGLADHKKGAKFMGVTQKEDSEQYKKCMAGINTFLDSVDKQIASYSDF